jgi:hypothetical protein
MFFLVAALLLPRLLFPGNTASVQSLQATLIINAFLVLIADPRDVYRQFIDRAMSAKKGT